MTGKELRRPEWRTLAGALMILAVGVARLAEPGRTPWYDVGGFAVVGGASLVAWYVDRALRWLKADQ